jgi:hypothetical protein
MSVSLAQSPQGVDFPWRLRIEHEGLLSLRMERKGRTIRFNPMHPPESTDIVILTGTWPEHLDATAAAVSAGNRPTVIAPQAVLDWLTTRGELSGHSGDVEVDGLRFESRSYVPLPFMEGAEAVRKVGSALRRPDRAVRRLARRASMPKAEPQAVRITFEDGATLVDAGLSLHGGCPDPWLAELCEAWGGPEWLITGVDYGEETPFLAQVGRIDAKRILVADLLGSIRRSNGLPFSLLTPVVDRAQALGLDAYVFATKVTMRFE